MFLNRKIAIIASSFGKIPSVVVRRRCHWSIVATSFHFQFERPVPSCTSCQFRSHRRLISMSDQMESNMSDPNPDTPTKVEEVPSRRKTPTTVKLEDITPWSKTADSKPKPFPFLPELNDKVSIFKGDITKLEIDVIVNAANERLLGGGGVDGAIHQAAGDELTDECETLNGCEPGDAKITGGYRLPAKHVIHTVGPRQETEEILSSCYQRCFEIFLEKGLKSIAFPCISTGIFGYPNDKAANVALKHTRTFLEENHDKVDRVIFCVFLDKDLKIYEELMGHYFPLQ